MNTLTTVVLGKVVSDQSKAWKEGRDSLHAGEHEIDSYVHVKGTLIVEDDKEITPTASLLNVDSLLLILKSAGVTRESAMKAISQVAGEYLVNWTGSDEDKAAADEARKAKLAEYDPDGKGREVFDEFKKSLPKIPSRGRVICKKIQVQEVAVPSGVVLENVG